MAELVEHGLDDGRFLAAETSDAQAATQAVVGLVLVDELQRAHTLIQALLADAQMRGSVTGFAVFAVIRSMIALRRGELAEAEADARAAHELCAEHGVTAVGAINAANFGVTLLERGNLEEATAVKTVSDHLSSAYRKLNISSRAELAAAMTSQAPPEAPESLP